MARASAFADRTATIAFEPNGQLVALGVVDTTFSSWQLGAVGQDWVEVQSAEVPVEFGSSGQAAWQPAAP